jgi:hypothetical protein
MAGGVDQVLVESLVGMRAQHAGCAYVLSRKSIDGVFPAEHTLIVARALRKAFVER